MHPSPTCLFQKAEREDPALSKISSILLKEKLSTFKEYISTLWHGNATPKKWPLLLTVTLTQVTTAKNGIWLRNSFNSLCQLAIAFLLHWGSAHTNNVHLVNTKYVSKVPIETKRNRQLSGPAASCRAMGKVNTCFSRLWHSSCTHSQHIWPSIR